MPILDMKMDVVVEKLEVDFSDHETPKTMTLIGWVRCSKVGFPSSVKFKMQLPVDLSIGLYLRENMKKVLGDHCKWENLTILENRSK